MRRHLPSTRSLLVFDAAARHGNLSRAAEELHLTHSAVSQQLRQLETLLGQPLFQRGARGVTLNPAGTMYREKIADTLARLESQTLDVMAMGRGDSSLLLGVVPVFADRWLVPRLPQFTALHPGVRLQVQVFPTNRFLAEPQYDVAIQYQNAVWPQASMLPLMAEDCIAVCATHAAFRPALLRGDFASAPLLHITSRPQAWSDWLAQAAGVKPPPNPLAGHRFDLFSMLVEAARAGLGVGLVPRFFVQRELDEGVLQQVHPQVQQDSQAYGLFIPAHRSHDPEVQAFAAWLLKECGALPMNGAPSQPPGRPKAGDGPSGAAQTRSAERGA